MQVLETCLAVYRGRRRRLLGELLGQQGGQEDARAGAEELAAEGAQALPARSTLQYLAGGPSARTLDVVPSTEVWLLRLLCTLHDGDVALTPGG